MHARSLVRLCDDVTALQAEVAALRASSQRSTAAEVVAELRAQRLEQELAAVRTEAAALRRDLDALREELVWAFAERRLPLDGLPVDQAPVDRAPVQHLRVARRSG